MKISRKDFFKSLTGGLLALSAVAVGKDVDKNEEVVVYADKIMPATGSTIEMGEMDNGKPHLLIESKPTDHQPVKIKVEGINEHDEHVVEYVPVGGHSVNIWKELL